MSGAGGVAEDVRSFFRAVFLVRCRLLSGRELGSVGAAQGPVCPRLFFFFFSRLSGVGRVRRLGRLGRRVGRPSRRLGRWLGGRPRVFFWEGFPLFSVPARRRLGGRAAGAFFVVRLFFSRFLRRSRRPPPSAGGRRSSTPPRRVFSPSFFLFSPLAWQDRARVELAVKARSSSLGCRPFFFPVRTRSSTPRRPVPPWRRHGRWSSNGRRRDPFFFRGWAGPANPPVAPRQADALALRREVERLPAHPSIAEIDRLRFRARAPRRRLRSVAVAEDPLAVVFPLFFPIDPSQECEPRPTFAFDLGLDLEKALGPAAFFFGGGFSSAERALRSAERALRSAERAQCRAGT